MAAALSVAIPFFVIKVFVLYVKCFEIGRHLVILLDMCSDSVVVGTSGS